MKRLIVPLAIKQQMVDHARRVLPAEAVGVLGGAAAAGRAVVAIPLPNVATHRTFLADPWAQFQAEKRLQEQQLDLLAVYHSHPGGGVAPSPSDRLFAAKRPLFHIIIALARPHRAGVEMKAYRLSGENLMEVEIVFEDNPR